MDNWDWFQSNRTIPESHKFITCYAAFNHMRIRRDGYMSPCCFSTRQQQWKKGEFSLKDYWFGKLNNEYQEAFLNSDFHFGCTRLCKTRIKNKMQPPILDYDRNTGNERLRHALEENSYPLIFEFEISNLCNFACPMCLGELSSKHMLGRDKFLKKYAPNIFDEEENANQLLLEFEEFIPHLNEIRFTGGEPFAHKFFYKLCDKIAKINPELSIMVCTNGSILNKKVEKVCKNNNLRLSISVDTIVPEEYEKIRVGGVWEETYSNVEKFIDKLGNKNVTLNSTFMSINASNIYQLFEYAHRKNVEFFINTYDRNGREHTKDWGLHTLSQLEILGICEKLLQIKSKIVNDSLYSYHKQNFKSINKCIRALENELN